ncbi:hypothetical protein BY458DRAFT_498735 [Sporodiniella umbellata]|nr:hypothetical protein BY458DRAFT_498735 [Sporodiniella umbellata]
MLDLSYYCLHETLARIFRFYFTEASASWEQPTRPMVFPFYLNWRYRVQYRSDSKEKWNRNLNC